VAARGGVEAVFWVYASVGECLGFQATETNPWHSTSRELPSNFGPMTPDATIFTETIGTPSGTTAIASYLGWSNPGFTFTGTGDVRNTTVSTGYAGASGGGNIFLTNSGNPTFQIAGVNTSSYSAASLVLSFGQYKNTIASNGTEMTVEVSSDGTTYSLLTFPARTTGSGTANWVFLTASGSIPATPNLRIRFTNTSLTPQFRVDDIVLTGTLAGGLPTLNINDVTQAETNAGATTFTFNVSLTSPAGAGGVTFDIATADGTAQDDNPATEDNDYVAKSEIVRTITSGNSAATFTVTVNGDTAVEGNETFFVNVSNVVGATAGDVQGLGTISNDDVSLTPIHTIQGSGSTSPLVSTTVTTSGIVTGTRSNGFYIQEPDAGADADPNTSEGIFVFTSSTPPAAAVIGNSVNVTGTVSEFIPSADPSSPPLTELVSPTVVLLTTGNSLPLPTLITAGETTDPSETTNPLDSLEEYEGMRVTVASLTVSGPTQGNVSEAGATASSNGVFLGVVTGVARPFREAGIAISDPLPAGAPVPIPRFDENPERIRVDRDAQPGATAIEVPAGTLVMLVVCCNALGDALRDALDPRMRP